MMTRPTWLDEPALQQFFAATRAAGGEARAVGGAVRDALLGRAGGDVDVASTLTPQQTIELGTAQDWKVVPTGIDHGTVTVVLPGRVVEVTTLRRDVETDGRRAVVAYTDCFEEDAARRDFTMNALYMDAEGNLYDYFNGQKDLAAHAVRFIGDAATRIREDGLRMLRFFRFLATHGAAPADAEAIGAIASLAPQLEQLSGERIASEMRKLLGAANPAYALSEMQRCGVPQYVTQQEWDMPMLQQLLQLETQHAAAAQWPMRLMALVPADARRGAVEWISERWKPSRAERSELLALSELPTAITLADLKEWLRAEPRMQVQGKTLLAALDKRLSCPLSEALVVVADWEVPRFPVTAKDLIARGHAEGKMLGDALRVLEKRWIESNYTLTRDALLA